MKHPKSSVVLVAILAVLLWILINVINIVKGSQWGWSQPLILLSTPVAVLVTVFLCRFRVARKKRLSYGTLLAGPFASALAVLVGWEFYYGGWDVLTLSYWLDQKGGLSGRVPELALIGGVSVLPAIAIVVYYQGRGGEITVAGSHEYAQRAHQAGYLCCATVLVYALGVLVLLIDLGHARLWSNLLMTLGGFGAFISAMVCVSFGVSGAVIARRERSPQGELRYGAAKEKAESKKPVVSSQGEADSRQ